LKFEASPGRLKFEVETLPDTKKGWQGGSSGRAPDYQMQSLEFKLQDHQKKVGGVGEGFRDMLYTTHSAKIHMIADNKASIAVLKT
jgi:hypothetical protein